MVLLLFACSKVAGIGTVKLSRTLALQSVLFVPNLDCNLLSVNKLNRDLDCETEFLANSPTAECRNLGIKSHCQFGSFESFDHSNQVSTIMMWHYRLGHPNFPYLEPLFPSLFINKNAKLFQCDVCQLSKHTRNHYAPRPRTPSFLSFMGIFGDPQELKISLGHAGFLCL